MANVLAPNSLSAPLDLSASAYDDDAHCQTVLLGYRPTSMDASNRLSAASLPVLANHLAICNTKGWKSSLAKGAGSTASCSSAGIR